jgi:cytochrome c553
MKKIIWVAIMALVPVLATGALARWDTGTDLSWAFPVPDKNPPAGDDDAGPRHLAGSDKAYTPAQIDDLMNPPDWYPEDHPAAPNVVAHGAPQGVLGCGSCHLMSGLGHPESADLAGMSAKYIERELADFKSGTRKDAARMNAIAKNLTDDDSKQASEWFAALRAVPWVKVVETDTVPNTWVTKTRMRMPLQGGRTEAIGERVIEVPADPVRTEERDPRSGFIAYVPKGSVAKGEQLAATGAGKTIQCSICHGVGLMGLGEVPRIAGLSPTYVGRQLYGFKSGTRGGDSAALMKGVVANLSDEDIVDLAAYLASKNP